MVQMAMNEIIVIDEDDDLEEGEITDDIEVVALPEEKPKQLPRRYTLHNNKSPSSRHKNCKHKEKNKSHNSPKLETIHRKKHKSSCPRHSSENYRLKHREIHLSHNSFAFKSAFKNYTSPPRAPPLPRKVNSDNENTENDFPKLLLDYKKAKERLLPKSENVQDHTYENNESVINDCKKANISPAKQEEIPGALPLEGLTEQKNGEESDEDDVEELRRIALATRAKKQLVSKVDDESSNEMPKPSSNNLSSSDTLSLNHLAETFHAECDNDSRDNYEVVDMDLDEEENSCQITNDDNLYVIDKMPAITEFSPNPNNGHLSQTHNFPVENVNHLSSNHSQPIDEFEEQLLRAEVIASMNLTRQNRSSPPKFITTEEKVSEIMTKVDMIHNAVSTLHNEMKPKPCAMYSKGPLQNSVKLPPKRIIDAKSKFSNFKNNKTTASPPPSRVVNTNTVQERLIITLNNDSSTEESEEEVNENGASQNVPMSSIEALISSARQKSDAAQFHNESSPNVSCLSKAQQEEYNSLKKLLAEKTQYSVAAPVVKEKNPDQSRINLLAKKISVAKANLEKDLVVKSKVEKELLERKKNYMTSKLKVQMLKEKLHAAEKIRAANLEKWKQSSAKLDIVRKSVSKRELILNLLETDLNARNTGIESNPTKAPV